MTTTKLAARHSSRDIIESWYANGDIGLLSDDIDCQAIGYGTARSRYQGRNAMLEDFLGEIQRKFSQWDVMVDRLIEAGDDVTAIGHYNAIPVHDDLKVLPFVHVWTVKDGKIVKVVSCTDAHW